MITPDKEVMTVTRDGMRITMKIQAVAVLTLMVEQLIQKAIAKGLN
jgi:hypothetical protein